jgi:hypothetical protein
MPGQRLEYIIALAGQCGSETPLIIDCLEIIHVSRYNEDV